MERPCRFTINRQYVIFLFTETTNEERHILRQRKDEAISNAHAKSHQTPLSFSGNMYTHTHIYNTHTHTYIYIHIFDKFIEQMIHGFIQNYYPP